MAGGGAGLSRTDRKMLALQAARVAANVRENLELPDDQPGCPYECAARLGLSVRFTDINMEGIYARSARPLILLSALRPLGRKKFNGAHELGHHVFGHGTRLDELQERGNLASWQDPDEFLADTFAGHFLMPVIGLRGAFRRRNWDIAKATPAQMYSVACDFGVGYRTLVIHLAYGIAMLRAERARHLLSVSPKAIRTSILGPDAATPFLIASSKRTCPHIDAETGMMIVLPRDTIAETGHLERIMALPTATVFRANSPGIAQVRSQDWRASIRISRKSYVGLAKYRHLEEL